MLLNRKRSYILAALMVPVLIVTLSGCGSSEDNSSSQSQSRESVATRANNDESTAEEPAADGVGIFADYSPDLVSEASAEDKVVLFFHAQWCSVCKRIESDINANLDSIPADTRILLVDFDDETELKQKYGVRQQYTMVQVDNKGNEIDSWNNSFSLDDILNTIV